MTAAVAEGGPGKALPPPRWGRSPAASPDPLAPGSAGGVTPGEGGSHPAPGRRTGPSAAAPLATLVAELEALARADPALADLPQRLAPLLALLQQVERGATLDVWVEFAGGHAVVADAASLYWGLVRDLAGPALGLEGEAGQVVLLLHHIQRVRWEHATGGVRVLLATGECLWFRAVRPGHSGLSRPARPAPAGRAEGPVGSGSSREAGREPTQGPQGGGR